MPRINVRNAKYALLKENTNDSYTLDEIHKLPNLRTIDLAIQMASGTLYGDGVIDENVDKITGAQFKFDINKLAISDRARMSGASYNGIMDLTTDDKAPEIAFYCETESSKAGGKEQLWLLCGKAQPIGLSGSQTEGNINFSTDTMTIMCTKRKKDNKVLRLGDTENTKFTEKDSKGFEESPDYVIDATRSMEDN